MEAITRNDAANQFAIASMVRELLKSPPGLVIELGAGTGTITCGLVEARQHMTGLIAFEKVPTLEQEGLDAAEIADALRPTPEAASVLPRFARLALG